MTDIGIQQASQDIRFAKNAFFERRNKGKHDEGL